MSQFICPSCKGKIIQAGKICTGVDDAKQHFVFLTCLPCGIQMNCLPNKIIRKHVNHLIGCIARTKVSNFAIKFFDNKYQADIFSLLVSEVDNPVDYFEESRKA